MTHLWFVRSEDVLKVFRAHDPKAVSAQNVRSECAGVLESERGCKMSMRDAFERSEGQASEFLLGWIV